MSQRQIVRADGSLGGWSLCDKMLHGQFVIGRIVEARILRRLVFLTQSTTVAFSCSVFCFLGLLYRKLTTPVEPAALLSV
jgi:hypothetical protein